MGTIAENIKARREELEMSQEELATKTGYKHRSAINKIELGINNFPMYKLNDFAIALRTSQERLLGYDENDLKSNESYFVVETMLTKNLRGGGGQNPEYLQFAADYVDRLVKLVYGKSAVQCLNLLEQLNDKGKATILDRMDELTRLDQYTVQDGVSGSTSVQDEN
ncbi:MAG: helix-turn-helix transcriptional regulator [Candidatus Fimivivens sp.]|nr:helix-turn-helix transcriptional regulator [Candidatus Fimivivens sp.]